MKTKSEAFMVKCDALAQTKSASEVPSWYVNVKRMMTILNRALTTFNFEIKPLTLPTRRSCYIKYKQKTSSKSIVNLDKRESECPDGWIFILIVLLLNSVTFYQKLFRSFQRIFSHLWYFPGIDEVFLIKAWCQRLNFQQVFLVCWQVGEQHLKSIILHLKFQQNVWKILMD